jgi:hypothetical protein
MQGASLVAYAKPHEYIVQHSDCTTATNRKAGGAWTEALWRLFRAILAPSHAQLDREIASIITQSGDRITDTLDHRIARHAATNHFVLRE